MIIGSAQWVCIVSNKGNFLQCVERCLFPQVLIFSTTKFHLLRWLHGQQQPQPFQIYGSGIFYQADPVFTLIQRGSGIYPYAMLIQCLPSYKADMLFTLLHYGSSYYPLKMRIRNLPLYNADPVFTLLKCGSGIYPYTLRFHLLPSYNAEPEFTLMQC